LNSLWKEGVMTKLDWEKAKRQERQRKAAKKKARARKKKPVHPNSMAAQKWRKKLWS
jgi:hypothetical protein